MEAEAPPGSPDAPQGGQLAKPGADRPAERHGEPRDFRKGSHLIRLAAGSTERSALQHDNGVRSVPTITLTARR